MFEVRERCWDRGKGRVEGRRGETKEGEGEKEKEGKK